MHKVAAHSHKILLVSKHLTCPPSSGGQRPGNKNNEFANKIDLSI